MTLVSPRSSARQQILPSRLVQIKLRYSAAPLVQYGIKANRPVLETAAQYSVEQGLTPRLLKLEEVFAPCTMEQ